MSIRAVGIRAVSIYLDYNATSPVRPDVVEAMLPWLARPANASSAHRFGRDATQAVDRARAAVADLCGWHREGVVFTGGATEANATLLSRGRWAVSAVEHPSVLAWGCASLPVDACGVVSLEALPDGITGMSVMLANNETGVIQPLRAIAAAARARGLLLHVDAAQAPGRIALDLEGADAVTISAHKLGGPQGVGALLLRRGLAVEALLRGGPQERGRRAGTHNVAGIVGFGVAAAGAGTMTARLRERLEGGLVALGAAVAGAGAERLPNTTCVRFDGIEAADLVVALDLAGIAASAGSACASGSPEPSHVLRAMRFAGSAVRFSLGRDSVDAEVDAVLATLPTILARMRPA